MLKVIAVRLTYQGCLLVILARFLRFLKGIHYRKSHTESERSDRFWPEEKFLNIIEHVSYSMRYCKIALHVYSGSSTFSDVGRFYDSLGIGHCD